LQPQADGGSYSTPVDLTDYSGGSLHPKLQMEGGWRTTPDGKSGYGIRGFVGWQIDATVDPPRYEIVTLNDLFQPQTVLFSHEPGDLESNPLGSTFMTLEIKHVTATTADIKYSLGNPIFAYHEDVTVPAWPVKTRLGHYSSAGDGQATGVIVFCGLGGITPPACITKCDTAWVPSAFHIESEDELCEGLEALCVTYADPCPLPFRAVQTLTLESEGNGNCLYSATDLVSNARTRYELRVRTDGTAQLTVNFARRLFGGSFTSLGVLQFDGPFDCLAETNTLPLDNDTLYTTYCPTLDPPDSIDVRLGYP